MNKRDIVLFINAIRPATFIALKDHEKRTGQRLSPVVLVDKKIKKRIFERNNQESHLKKLTVLSVDFDNPAAISKLLRPYQSRIFSVTAQYENCIFELQKAIPSIPYLSMPTEKSLEWSTEKKMMRSMLEIHNPNLIPKYLEIKDASSATVAMIERTIPYPLIIKPSALEGSLLVSLARNRKELQKSLNDIYINIQKGYDIWIKRQKPSVLVEEFMEGDMYSVDCYISSSGKCYSAPLVKVITGHKIGFDDFFGYARLTPTDLDEAESKRAQDTALTACRALGLRSITAHVELMKTKLGWKVIEVGPRIGGYRHEIYNLSYGINHIMNDILIRAGEKPHIPRSLKQYTALFNIYAPEEGILMKVKGINRIEKLSSFVSLRQVLGEGQIVQFAKNNGDPILEITMSNKNKRQLQKDIELMEKELDFEVEQPSSIYV